MNDHAGDVNFSREKLKPATRAACREVAERIRTAFAGQ